MAKAYITEYRDLFRAGNGHITQIPSDYGVDQSPVDFTGGATQSAAFKGGSTYVRINVDSACCIAFGSNPTASTAKRMSAGATEFWPVAAGDKASFISVT